GSKARRDRLLGAAYAGVPVGVAALRGLLPCPDMDLVERRQPVAIGRADVVQEVPIECRHTAAWIIGYPHALEHDELDADQTHLAVRHRLVDERLWLLRLQHARADAREL